MPGRGRSRGVHQLGDRSRPARRRVVEADVPSTGDDDAPVDDDVGDVGCRGREYDGLHGRAAARRADRPHVDRDQVGARADAQAPRVRPAERGCPSRVAAPSSLSAPSDRRARGGRRRSSSSTARASSNRSITAWESDPRLNSPRPASSAACRPDPVAEIPLGGRTEAHARRGAIEVGDVLGGQVGGVHGGGARAEHARVPQQCRRGAPWTARHWSTSAVCSDECTCRGAPWASAHSTTAGMCSSGTPRTECSAAPTITC